MELRKRKQPNEREDSAVKLSLKRSKPNEPATSKMNSKKKSLENKIEPKQEIKEEEKEKQQVLVEQKKGSSEKSDDWNIQDYLLDDDWKSLLKDEFEQDYFKQLNEFLRKAYSTENQTMPPKELVFNAFNSTKPKNVYN